MERDVVGNGGEAEIAAAGKEGGLAISEARQLDLAEDGLSGKGLARY